MDFIERVFHVSFDGGTGATEMTYLLAGLVAAIVWKFRRRWYSRNSHHVTRPGPGVSE